MGGCFFIVAVDGNGPILHHGTRLKVAHIMENTSVLAGVGPKVVPLFFAKLAPSKVGF
ncbi:hypothetical protein [Corynebacterium ulcerans]|uniref:hypothetical protein n=1 Tax=Corynebacterium ulcerans TaxID=65058 RepID=UPI0034A5105C